MITVAEALKLVEQWATRLPVAAVDFRDALGLRLAQAVVSGVDSPPFDKAMLDGYAVIAEDDSPTRQILEEVIAGGVPHRAVVPGATIRVMTGAPTPEGADVVIKHEDTKLLDDSTVQLPAESLKPGAGVMRRGESFRAGQELLPTGKVLSPIDLALLAEIGQLHIEVVPRPRVAVVSTGNELVPCGEAVGPGQITNSNGPMLAAMLQSYGAEPIDLGIVHDEPAALLASFTQGLEYDVLLITGGVSAGMMDLVPGVLGQLGVKQVFHKVKMKPGKPVWFGVLQEDEHRTLVFGLPGNPVSALVGMVLFVKPALAALAGEEFAAPRTLPAVLTKEIKHKAGRATYYPCLIEHGRRQEGKPSVTPLAWRGSADLATVTKANALLLLEMGVSQYEAGQVVEVIAL